MGVKTKILWRHDDVAPGHTVLTNVPDPDAYGLTITVNTTAEIAGVDPTDFYEGTLLVDKQTNAMYVQNNGVWVATTGGGGGSSGGVPTTRRIDTVAPLVGGGDLSADRSLSVNNFSSAARGTVPASGGDPANFLRADGTWAVPPVGVQPTDPGLQEVFIGPDDPGAPYELWFDSDATAAPVIPPPTTGLEANRPASSTPGAHYFATDTKRDWQWDGTQWVRLGVLGYHQLTAPYTTTGTHSTSQATGVQATINEPVGRRLRITVTSNPYVTNVGNVIAIDLARAGTVIARWYIAAAALDAQTASANTLVVNIPNSTGGANIIYRVQIYNAAANVAVFDWADSYQPRSLTIEDAGPF